MNALRNIFGEKNKCRGGMLVELLLSVALATIIIPFVFRYQQNSVVRAQNIAITNQMAEIQVALERYIVENRSKLLNTVGRNITRVELADLVPFGIPETLLENADNRYQLRVLKSSDTTGSSTLQGVIVRDSDDVTPIRTREIVNLSGGSMGFVDGTRAYGTFGAWHTDVVDLGIDITDGIVETTNVNRDAALYLWRVPSNNSDDSKMLSPLNLAGHDITNTKFLNANYVDFAEGFKSLKTISEKLIFENRTAIDNGFKTVNATVSGVLSSDGKNMNVAKNLNVSDIAKLSSITTQNLWVSKLTLSGLSIETDDIPMLKINQALDMTSGRIEAMFVTVGFTGSMTPRLVVYDKIADSINSNFYWDAKSGVLNFMDASFVELSRMATQVVRSYGDKGTDAFGVFSAVSANKNATVSDYMNAIKEIQNRVRGKYRLLNLE
ncbi:MAG: hypothetical protein II208_01930 [Alphaproteobacteria bacterium]|nr:hypothetical protein [Alphaproteobacteria bacterium]